MTEVYDGVLCAGGFVNGHLKPEVCDEFLRVLKPGIQCTYSILFISIIIFKNSFQVKILLWQYESNVSGGYCIIGMRESFLHLVEEYKGLLEPYMTGMDGWTLVERIEEPNWFVNLEGVVFIFQKNLLQ